MALFTGIPKPPSFPSGRYTHTNPLRREAGLRLLTESLLELPNLHRQRPSEASLPSKAPYTLG